MGGTDKEILYTRKCWQEKTLANLVNRWPIAKVFSLKFTKKHYGVLILCISVTAASLIY